MLYRLIRTKRVVSHILLPLLAAGIWSLQIISPSEFGFYEGENEMFLFKPLFLLLHNWAFASIILGLILLILTAILIQRINVEYGFFRIKTLLPGIIFILVTGGFQEMRNFHPVYIAIIFLLVAIYRLFSAFDQRKPYSEIFDACFLLGISSLFYLNMLTLLPAFIAGGSILGRETRWREILVSIIGFITPWLFVFTWFFLYDRIPEMISVLKDNFLTPNDRIVGNIPVMVFLVVLILFTLTGSYRIMVQYDEKKVSIRQYFLFFFLMFASSILSIILVPAASTEILLVAAIPVTFLLSNLLLSFKRAIWGEVIIYLLLGFNLVLQFISQQS
jgi:hypothetical protein